MSRGSAAFGPPRLGDAQPLVRRELVRPRVDPLRERPVAPLVFRRVELPVVARRVELPRRADVDVLRAALALLAFLDPVVRFLVVDAVRLVAAPEALRRLVWRVPVAALVRAFDRAVRPPELPVRATSFEKRLGRPVAVCSWYRKARLFFSNLSKKSSQLIFFSDFTPEYPG